jgi:hypothetical protein
MPTACPSERLRPSNFVVLSEFLYLASYLALTLLADMETRPLLVGARPSELAVWRRFAESEAGSYQELVLHPHRLRLHRLSDAWLIELDVADLGSPGKQETNMHKKHDMQHVMCIVFNISALPAPQQRNSAQAGLGGRAYVSRRAWSARGWLLWTGASETAWVQFLPSLTFETCLCCSATSGVMKLACLLF